MKQKYKITVYIIVAVTLLLFLTNPPESQFLFKVSQDYGQMHAGANITTDALLQIGESKRESYGVFSLYTYRFGNISVSYLGIANRTYFLGSTQLNELPSSTEENIRT